MKTFIVLGMHRSATSLAAKGLHMAGIDMGERLLGAMPSNPYGHFEDRDFIEMNDQILQAAGGSWDQPPDEDAVFRAGLLLRDRIHDLITERKKSKRHWGW